MRPRTNLPSKYWLPKLWAPNMVQPFLRKLPGSKWLRGGWPDEARFVIQSAALRRVLDGYGLEGICLDAGAGEGLYAQFLDDCPKLERIVHLDLEARGIARRFSNQRHEDVVGSVTHLPFAAGAFDFCLCTEVMEHVRQDEEGFSELARVLRRDGLLLLTTPMPPAPFDPAHVREGYNYTDLREHLERHGFEVLKHTFCFHWLMRKLLLVWRWQFKTLGDSKRSWMPRFLIHFLAILDRFLPIGKPWNLVVLARRK